MGNVGAVSAESRVPAPHEATMLCLACGLCCDGTLHDRAKLGADEVEPMRALGLPILDTHPPYFKLGCPHFDGCCTVFPLRPRICGSYRCKLLLTFDRGEIDLEEAHDRVRRARALRAVVDNLTEPSDSLFDTRAELLAFLRGEQSAGANGERTIAMLALLFYVEKHFMKDGKRTLAMA